jgi:hypothetical protein
VRFVPGLAFLVVAPQLTLAHSDRKKVPLPAEKLVRFNHLPIRLLSAFACGEEYLVFFVFRPDTHCAIDRVARIIVSSSSSP